MLNRLCCFFKIRLNDVFWILRVAVVVACSLVSVSAWAENRIEKDPDEDGRVDQVLVYDDAGTILRVEIDTDHDGYAERRRIYEDGRPVRIERDTDNNRKIDCIDYIENEKRIRQERFDPDGNLVQVSLFDDAEQIRLMKKDTTGNKQFDTHYYFTHGILLTSTRDMDDNGRVNVWTTFNNQLPVEQKHDENEDGIMDRVLMFDVDGKLETLFKEPFAKEQYRSTGFFEKGEIKTRYQDKNEDGKPDVITKFEKTLPVEQKKDTNFDDRFDVMTRFVNGLPKIQEKDTDFDGKTDYFAGFDDKGQLAKTREDTQGTGKIDRIRYYRAGELHRVERDNDRNGVFETVSLMENSRIVKNRIDKNQDGQFDIEVFYTDTVLRRKELDENFDGVPDVVEIFNKTGILEKIEERKQGNTSLAWFYDAKEILVRGEEDKNGDGKPEIWYLYDNGNLTSVQEDTNLDGQPDLWEVYDETQAVVKREKDLDFDGRPDFVDLIEEAETDS